MGVLILSKPHSPWFESVTDRTYRNSVEPEMEALSPLESSDTNVVPRAVDWKMPVHALLPARRRARSGPLVQRLRYLQVSQLVRMLQQIARKVGTTPAALAIAWSAAQQGVTTSIVGAKRAEQIQKNAEAGALLERPKLMNVLDHLVARQPPI